jgi:ABC-2 type transport system ATP-binding protein
MIPRSVTEGGGPTAPALLPSPVVSFGLEQGDVALSFDGISKRYRNGPLALDSVSFVIREGSRTCLLGPNGSGKTTAIRLLQGLLRPTTGKIQVLGAELGTPDYLEARRRTGIVPQSPGMYPDVRLVDYLELARRLFGKGDVGRVVEALDLGDVLLKPMAHLSGGFQRRVSLAAALLPEPDVLLLDEPTVGLDPLAALQVRQVLREAVRGRTVLLCTHDLSEAEDLTDDVLMLRSGRVIVHAAMRDLSNSLHAKLRVASRQPTSDLMRTMAAAGYAGVAADDGTVSVSVEDPRVDAPSLLRHLLSSGFDVYECTVLRPTLEDVFVERMREV